MNEPETPILRMLDAYRAAVHAKDVDAFMALFADDVRIFDMWGRWSYDGAAAWRAMATDWFGSLGDERVAVGFDEVKVFIGGEIAVASAFVTFTGLAADGRKLRSLNNRLTWALRLRGGTWKVVHEHTSAPVAHETGKVTLQR